MTSAVIRRLGRKGGTVIVGEIIFGDLKCRLCEQVNGVGGHSFDFVCFVVCVCVLSHFCSHSLCLSSFLKGDDESNILICERCNGGFHLYCLRPVLPAVPPGSWYCAQCDTQTRAERLNFEQCKRRWLVARPREVFRFFGLSVKSLVARPAPAPDALAKLERSRSCFRLPRPSLDVTRRLLQYASLASAMTSKNMRFEHNLWYEGAQAHRNVAAGIAQREGGGGAAKRLVCRAEHNHYLKETEKGELDAPLKSNATPIQPLSANNRRLFEHYKQMSARGESTPLLVKHNGGSGFMVVADDPILNRTILCECVRSLSSATALSLAP